MKNMRKKLAVAFMMAILVLVSVSPAAANTDGQDADLTRKVNEYEGQHR